MMIKTTFVALFLSVTISIMGCATEKVTQASDLVDSLSSAGYIEDGEAAAARTALSLLGSGEDIDAQAVLQALTAGGYIDEEDAQKILIAIQIWKLAQPVKSTEPVEPTE